MISPAVISAGLVALTCQRRGNNIQRFTELHFGDGERVQEADDVAIHATAQAADLPSAHAPAPDG